MRSFWLHTVKYFYLEWQGTDKIYFPPFQTMGLGSQMACTGREAWASCHASGLSGVPQPVPMWGEGGRPALAFSQPVRDGKVTQVVALDPKSHISTVSALQSITPAKKQVLGSLQEEKRSTTQTQTCKTELSKSQFKIKPL